MFKSGRWKAEKSKIKAVFMLQFQATQVPPLKSSTLTVSLVPEDVGKPTVRLEKAPVVEGVCFWENPVYETVKLTKDQKTGIIGEKCYHFIVSSGSSKKGILGEIAINLADFADATEPSVVSLQLKSPNYKDSAAILHVSIQNVNIQADKRDGEAAESPVAKPETKSLKNELNTHGGYEEDYLNFDEVEYNNELTEIAAEYMGSFRSLSPENAASYQDHAASTQDSVHQKRTVGVFPENNKHVRRRSNTDWSLGSASNASDSTNSHEENLPKASDRCIEKLLSQVSALERQGEISELELQSLRKQIVKETKRVQDLSRQISGLKEERDTLRTECESSSRKCSDREYQLQKETEKLEVKLEEIKQELSHEKSSNKTLRLQLQKTEDSNCDMILAIRDLDEIVEQKTKEIDDLSATICQNEQESQDESQKDEELAMFEQKIKDLYSEIEIYMKDQDELKIENEQLSMDYEILKQKNSDVSLVLERNQIEMMNMQNENSKQLAAIKEFKFQVERLEKEIDNLTLELSESSDTIEELQTRVQISEKELEKQAQLFEDDLVRLKHDKLEQEQRAVRAEEALRKTRSSNSIAVERIQEEFRRLSVEMACKLDENEKMAINAVTEANDLHMQKKVLEEKLLIANEELCSMKKRYEIELQELSNQTVLKSNQVEKMSKDLQGKCTQVENFKKREEEIRKAFSVDIEKLKDEIKGLKTKSSFSQGREQKKKLITSIHVNETIEGRTKETEQERRELSSGRGKEHQLQKQSDANRPSKDGGSMVDTLRTEIDQLRLQYTEVKQYLSEVELENENLRLKVLKLETGLEDEEKQNTNQSKKKVTSRDDTIVQTSCDFVKEVVSEKLNLNEEDRCAEEPNAKDLDFQLSKMKSRAGTFKQHGVGKEPVKRDETCTPKGWREATCPTTDNGELTQFLSQMEILKERNKCMEAELKEMQERYSEISLKFAEVEGERQQLVMTVRNLKNTKKK